MPPKAAKTGEAMAASTSLSTKRKSKKESDSDNNNEETHDSTVKKAKIAKEPLKPLDPTLPTNTTFPIDVSFEAKREGTTRLSTWNGKELGLGGFGLFNTPSLTHIYGLI